MGILRAAWRGALLALLCAALPGAASPAQEASPEYQVKAVLLVRIAQFIDWPAGAFQSANSPIVIGVLGDDPFGRYLTDAAQGERIGDRPLFVRRYRRVDDIDDCQVLFVSGSEAGQVGEILERLKGRSLLTVGDADGFCRDGGMVQFAVQNNKIRLRIRIDAARGSGLKVSSKLLRLATVVDGEEN